MPAADHPHEVTTSLTFSFFPVRRNARRYGLNDVVFAVDPWAVIDGAVADQVAAGDKREETLAFVAQARASYEAAASRTPASPLLFYYYAFLNLGKALIRCRGFTESLDHAYHGLSAGKTVAAADLTSGTVTVQNPPAGRRAPPGSDPPVNVFPELINRLGYARPTQPTIPIPELAAQVVVGHRL